MKKHALLLSAAVMAVPAAHGHGMVTGTTGSTAIEGGVEILKAGGSAADAAMATALTQVCMAAGSWVSYAGIMTMVYFDAASGRTYNMNAAYNTVKAETDATTLPGINPVDLAKDLHGGSYQPSGRTALVPGFMAGVEAAHERFGKLPRQKVFEPAIRCAEQGVEWSKGLQGQYEFRKAVLGRLPETKAVYVKPDGSAYQPGETFKQPALAQTLRHVANDGAEYMYRGPWAKKFISALARDGGRMTLEDLANYKVIWSEPLHSTYHGYDLYVHGMPADGGVNLVQAMNLAEIAGLSQMGKYSQSPQAMFTLAQIAKVQMLFEYDPGAAQKLGIDLSLTSRVKKETAATLWKEMQARRAATVSSANPKPAHSDAVVVIDQWGNIAAVCHSINAVSWGATGINVDGVSIPDSASFQREAIAKVAPGERLPDPTQPGLVVLNGKPFMGFSSIGAGLQNRTLGALVNVMDFGMTPQQAIDEPSLGSFLFGVQAEGGPPLAVGKGDLTPEFIAKVGELGQPIVENDALRGYWIGVQVDPKTGELHGGAIRELALGGRAVGY
jgi:gamma-glutamyltranspeptidase/glutathione hydrolase